MVIILAETFWTSVFSVSLKGQFNPKSKIHIFPLLYSAIYTFGLFWPELLRFGDIDRRDFSLSSNIMELDCLLSCVAQIGNKMSLS